jgi:flavin reductase (DIM6/NTAB) family NADH-FMN oxidoreductase RutF
VGTFSGKTVDKSQVFEVFYGGLKTAPIIAGCPLSMECKLYDVYELPQFDVFIGEIVETYADENVLTDGKVDLSKVNPLLFDMTSVQYWSLGKAAGKCWNIGRQYGNSE